MSNSKDPKNFVSTKCVEFNDIQQLKTSSKENNISLFHVNACQLSKNYHEP